MKRKTKTVTEKRWGFVWIGDGLLSYSLWRTRARIEREMGKGAGHVVRVTLTYEAPDDR